ncbi:hypothetical protein ACVBEQ_05265 [Nakamurella sp. GG22]
MAATVETLAPVHPMHDIHQGVNVVRTGWRGRVVSSWPNWFSTTYSVEFSPRGVPGATVTMSGLTERDVQAD